MAWPAVDIGDRSTSNDDDDDNSDRRAGFA